MSIGLSNKKSLSRTYRKNKERQALKKDVQSIVLIGIVSILLVVAIILAVFFFMGKTKRGEVSYPSSPLTQETASHYSYIENAKLPQKLTMPYLPVIVSMGGSQRYVPYNGYVYLYSSNLYISAYELWDTRYNTFSSQFVSDLYAGELAQGSSWVYNVASTSTGYYNGYPAEYECGQCDLLNDSGRVTKSIYIVSITLNMGLEAPVCIAVSTPEETSLYSSAKVLENVCNTVMDTSQTAYIIEDSGEGTLGNPVFE